MIRREFIKAGAATAGLMCGLLATVAKAASPREWRPSEFHAARRFVDTRFGRIAYVERGTGPAALFLHGWPLNGFQWRGAMAGLSDIRRCVAIDFMGLGYSDVPADADLSPIAQTEMLVTMMDALEIKAADIVSNDSATAIAQLLATHHPTRVRTLLLTNGDVHTNSPPASLEPVLVAARAGELIGNFDRQLADALFAQSSESGITLGPVYTDPRILTPELLEVYLRPLVTGKKRRRQAQDYGLAFLPNPLLAIESKLRRSAIPARMVWGSGDLLFPAKWAAWLHQTLPRSRGVKFVEGAKLFFPEEFPEIIEAEARSLWS